jgi:two-component system, OmpR family, sensor histidine kinase QseC
MVGIGEGWDAVSIEVHEASDVVQKLRETSHDMRQPVASVFALAEAALAEPRLPTAARERLKQIVGQAEWLADMIDGFLHDSEPEDVSAASQTDPGESDEAASHPDVVRIVNEVVAAGRLVWPCAVRVVSTASPVRCTLHPSLLRRIVSNVLSNAARAAGSSGLVTVRIRRRNGQVMLVVEDSGPGFGNIPTGNGLGLSVVARHIVSHGGRVECDRSAGGGARVCLWIP